MMKVLLIEDSRTYTDLILQQLEGFKVHCVADLSEIHKYVNSEIDVVLCDLTLPSSSGADTVRSVRKSFPWLPIVVITAVPDTKVHAQCIRAGANSVYVKGNYSPSALLRSLEVAILSFSLQQNETEEEESTKEQVARVRVLLESIQNKLDAVTQPE
jgi:CheY-like chemotaxis protein